MKGPFSDRCQVIISDSLKLLTLLPTFHRHQVFWHGFSYVQICFWSCGIFWEMEKKTKRGWLPSFANWWMNLVCTFGTVSYRPHIPSHLTKMHRSTHICALILLKSAISSPLHKKRKSNGFDLLKQGWRGISLIRVRVFLPEVTTVCFGGNVSFL